jgi:hypothetical protein
MYVDLEEARFADFRGGAAPSDKVTVERPGDVPFGDGELFVREGSLPPMITPGR